jgi:hypothetical protein
MRFKAVPGSGRGTANGKTKGMLKTAVRRVQATRYVTPLREGGSLPAIVEAEDDGLYVLKFRGAGQGPLALVAELLAGEIGRALGLSVPEIVLIDLDAALGRNEPDPEVHDLLLASAGLNLAMDYLPGSVMFDQAAGDRPGREFASQTLWFDAFVTNVDRTARNPNLLRWHDNLYLIDHGAALYFQHQWENIPKAAESRFAAIRQHVLLPWASGIRAADEVLRPCLNSGIFEDLVALLPDEWLTQPGVVEVSGSNRRAGYLEFLNRRLAGADAFVEEALEAHAKLL